MSKLTLLLIPLIFLSSCTIDWNNKFDKTLTNICTFATKGKDNIYSLKYETCIVFTNTGGAINAIDITSDINKDTFRLPTSCYQDSFESGRKCTDEINKWKKSLK